jgi:hypothetical protein
MDKESTQSQDWTIAASAEYALGRLKENRLIFLK